MLTVGPHHDVAGSRVIILPVDRVGESSQRLSRLHSQQVQLDLPCPSRQLDVIDHAHLILPAETVKLSLEVTAPLVWTSCATSGARSRAMVSTSGSSGIGG